MSYKQIQTYDEMNSTIKELLERQDDNVSLYALKRIEELEQQVSFNDRYKEGWADCLKINGLDEKGNKR